MVCSGLSGLQTFIVAVLQHGSHHSERALVIFDQKNVAQLVMHFSRRLGGLIAGLHSSERHAAGGGSAGPLLALPSGASHPFPHRDSLHRVKACFFAERAQKQALAARKSGATYAASAPQIWQPTRQICSLLRMLSVNVRGCTYCLLQIRMQMSKCYVVCAPPPKPRLVLRPCTLYRHRYSRFSALIGPDGLHGHHVILGGMTDYEHLWACALSSAVDLTMVGVTIPSARRAERLSNAQHLIERVCDQELRGLGTSMSMHLDSTAYIQSSKVSCSIRPTPH